MLSAIRQLRENIERVRAIGGLYEALGQLTTPLVDASDLLRTQVAMAVSALDHYVHEVTRIGMLEVYDGTRPRTNAFIRFQVTMDAAMAGIAGSRGNGWLDAEIRERHAHLAFQHPDRIADAVRLFYALDLWTSVAFRLNLRPQEVRTQLRLIVDRRNRIVHEADLDPSYPGSRWPISYFDARGCVDFVEAVCEAIHSVVTSEEHGQAP